MVAARRLNNDINGESIEEPFVEESTSSASSCNLEFNTSIIFDSQNNEGEIGIAQEKCMITSHLSKVKENSCKKEHRSAQSISTRSMLHFCYICFQYCPTLTYTWAVCLKAKSFKALRFIKITKPLQIGNL